MFRSWRFRSADRSYTDIALMRHTVTSEFFRFGKVRGYARSVSITKTGYPKTTWRRVLLKTAVTCAYCGKALDPDEYGMCSPIPPPNGAWEVDHWIPKSSFTKPWDAEAFENLWPACCGCNDEKNNTTGEEYIAKRKAAGLPTNTSADVMKRFKERTSA